MGQKISWLWASVLYVVIWDNGKTVFLFSVHRQICYWFPTICWHYISTTRHNVFLFAWKITVIILQTISSLFILLVLYKAKTKSMIQVAYHTSIISLDYTQAVTDVPLLQCVLSLWHLLSWFSRHAINMSNHFAVFENLEKMIWPSRSVDHLVLLWRLTYQCR